MVTVGRSSGERHRTVDNDVDAVMLAHAPDIGDATAEIARRAVQGSTTLSAISALDVGQQPRLRWQLPDRHLQPLVVPLGDGKEQAGIARGEGFQHLNVFVVQR